VGSQNKDSEKEKSADLENDLFRNVSDKAVQAFGSRNNSLINKR